MGTSLNPNLIMFIVAILSLLAGVLAGAAIAYMTAKGRNPQAALSTADKVIDGAVTANNIVGQLLPAPVESIAKKVLDFAQSGVHAAQQLYDSQQLPEGQRKQKAFEMAMNLLKLEGMTPTLELEAAVKDAIEAGVFVVKNAYWNTPAQTAAVAADLPPASTVQAASPGDIAVALINELQTRLAGPAPSQVAVDQSSASADVPAVVTEAGPELAVAPDQQTTSAA